ncbi:MAG: hypothetical protein LKF71_04445 [Oscillospiraceae bacterium]|jgi:hypothetical protein|nr:hypothetical protein [Oscillospiraceae bacterium]
MRNNHTAETGTRLEHNPWGYQVNINHPQIRPIFERYLKQHGIPPWCPLSDAERREFEAAFMAGAEKKAKRKAKQKSVIDLTDFDTPDCETCSDPTKYISGKMFDAGGAGEVTVTYGCQNQQCRKIRKAKDLYLMRSMGGKTLTKNRS